MVSRIRELPRERFVKHSLLANSAMTVHWDDRGGEYSFTLSKDGFETSVVST